MENTLSIRLPAPAQWRDLALPKEHGSWSLAFEPLALGLIAAPSVAGAWLAVAVAGAFFARRPFRIAWRETRPERRDDARIVLGGCIVVAMGAFAAAILAGGAGWLVWLVAPAVAGGVFLAFDLRNGGREEAAEVAGSAAFAMLPAALAVVAGATPAAAVALALVMLGRSVPTVLCVRAALRGAKTGIRRPLPALVAAFAALGIAALLVRAGLAPAIAVGALLVLALRAVGLLVFPRPALRGRTIGMIEAVAGVVFVAVVAMAWRG